MDNPPTHDDRTATPVLDDSPWWLREAWRQLGALDDLASTAGVRRRLEAVGLVFPSCPSCGHRDTYVVPWERTDPMPFPPPPWWALRAIHVDPDRDAECVAIAVADALERGDPADPVETPPVPIAPVVPSDEDRASWGLPPVPADEEREMVASAVDPPDDRDRVLVILRDVGGLSAIDLAARARAAGVADPDAALGALLAAGLVVGPHGGRYYDETTYDRWDAADVLPRLSRLTSAAERRHRPPKRWTVDRVIPEYGVGQVFGPSYEGKSFVAIDLALRVANGLTNWHGHEVSRSGPVVFVLMEGVFDFQERVDAWLAAHPGTSDAGLLTLEEEDVDLADPRSCEMLESDVFAAAPGVALVVIDTQALATPGTKENENTEMNVVFSHLKRLAKRLGCPIATVHHTGHDNQHRARGASAQRAALDFEVSVDDGAIRVTKVKAGEPVGPYGFVLEPSGPSVWAKPAPAGRRRRDLNGALLDAGDDGLTVIDAAAALGRGSGDADLKKTRRDLARMAKDGLVEKVAGQRGGGTGGAAPDRYVATSNLRFAEGDHDD